MSRWMLSVGGRTYGPYTNIQMQSFAYEGRLASHSLTSKEDDCRFAPATHHPELAHLFQPAAALARQPEPEALRPFGQGDAAAKGGPAHFLIVADMKSGSITALEDEIFRLGAASTVLPQAWVLTCDLSIGALRNQLVQKLGKLDALLIADASHDKLSWSNLGLEAETRVRRIWTKQPHLSAA